MKEGMGVKLSQETTLGATSVLGEFEPRSVVHVNSSAPRSRHGIVNVYGTQDAPSTNDRPKLLKSLGNLTTGITTLRFNPDSQMMAMASNSKKDQLRVVCQHFASI